MGGGRQNLWLFLNLILRRNMVKLLIHRERFLVYGNVANDTLKCTCWQNTMYLGSAQFMECPRPLQTSLLDLLFVRFSVMQDCHSALEQMLIYKS